MFKVADIAFRCAYLMGILSESQQTEDRPLSSVSVMEQRVQTSRPSDIHIYPKMRIR